MPNKTIYLSDDEEYIWEGAERLAERWDRPIAWVIRHAIKELLQKENVKIEGPNDE